MKNSRVVKPILVFQITGTSGSSFYQFDRQGFVPGKNRAFMHVIDGVVTEVSSFPVYAIKSIPTGKVFRLYSIPMKLCKKCNGLAEAERYDYCFDCWWRDDPRNKSPF